MKREYESLLVVKPTSSEEEVTNIVNKFTGLVKNDNGEILKIDNIGIKNLAYDIKNFKNGHFVVLNFKALPAFINKLGQNYRTDESIIRFVTIVKNG